MASDMQHGPGDTILDRYELVRLLGSGGWGRVYLANDHMLHRPVAIKQLLPRLAADPTAVSRFMREASVIASIREPHVLTVYDIAERNEQHYMVMEYADAGTLSQVLQLEGSLPPYEALSVAIDVCRGLRAVHSKGVVHRDVKPANVMFFSRPDGLPVAKIGDFGIALHPTDERLTPSDNVVGTLIYLSPEQAANSSTITHLSDLYSMGVMLYEMIHGELKEPLFLNPLFANGNSAELREHLSGLPEPVQPLLIKALQRKPEDRFQTADELLQALQRARSRLTVSVTTQTFEDLTPVEPTIPVARRRMPSRLLAVIAVGVMLLLVGAIAAYGLVSGPTRPTSEPAQAAPVSSPTATDTQTPAPTPSATPLPSDTPVPSPSPTSTATPLPSPTATAGAAIPARVTGPISLRLMLHDSQNAPQDTYTVPDNPSTTDPILYLEGSYLWGEVETRVGNTVFKINRDAPDPNDPSQHLPSYLSLKIEYSGALLAAVREDKQNPPGSDAHTGEFWVGRFQCGSAIAAKDSPYRVSVRLLENGQEVAKRFYTIGVLNNPNCVDEGDSGGGGGPPSRR
jgi:serine/threonine protein kinase